MDVEAGDVVKESTAIPKQSPKTFNLGTLTLIFPLSIAILAHYLFFTHTQLPAEASSDRSEFSVFRFLYFILVFAYSLISTAAAVSSVVSRYSSKPPVSFFSTISTIPSVFKPLFITFPWLSLTMVVYNIGFLALLNVAANKQNDFLLHYSFLFVMFTFHICISALWHLASVVSLVEPAVYGLAAMKQSYELLLLKGKIGMNFSTVLDHFATSVGINHVFELVVVHGVDFFGAFTSIVLGGFLVGLLLIVNLMGLLVQSMFYYVHHQGIIDKSALYHHLGGYLGQYLPLKSRIQMEKLDPHW